MRGGYDYLSASTVDVSADGIDGFRRLDGAPIRLLLRFAALVVVADDASKAIFHPP